MRGLDESHCVPGYKPRLRIANSTTFQRRSQVMSDLLASGARSNCSYGLLPKTDDVSDSA